MQFGREPLPKTPEMMTADGERGWVCSNYPGHFQLASERRAHDGVTTTQLAAAGWVDDGGTAEK